MARSPSKAAEAAPAEAAPIAEPAPVEPAPIAEPASAEPPPAPAAGLGWVATTYIEHDGEPYNVGDTLVLTEKQAAPLLAVKAIKLKGETDV